jgi:aryl-alcohol dehydrogenase-like predicted oxidoreductase
MSTSPTAVPSEGLALGTVQLGLPYGVANGTGQPSREAALEILETAWRRGIRCFDSAQAYGSSEALIGDFARGGRSDGLRVVTKLHPDARGESVSRILDRIARSREQLGVKKIWGLMLHREEMLASWHSDLGRALRQAVEREWVGRLGLSAYSCEAVERTLAVQEMELVQMPANVFDRRLHRSGLLPRLAGAGRTVFVRSIYLQGLVLMDPAQVPPGIPRGAEAVRAIEQFCAKNSLERAAFAMRYARQTLPGAVLVVGAETAEQVDRNCDLFESAGRVPAETWDRAWPDDTPGLIDPSQWPAA